MKRDSGMGMTSDSRRRTTRPYRRRAASAPGISILDLIVLFPEEPQADVHDFRIVEFSPIS